MFWLNYQISKSEGQTNLNMPLQNIQKKIATANWSNIIPFFLKEKTRKTYIRTDAPTLSKDQHRFPHRDDYTRSIFMFTP